MDDERKKEGRKKGRKRRMEISQEDRVPTFYPVKFPEFSLVS